MFDVRALPRVGPVAQRLEQGTHNLSSWLGKIFYLANHCAYCAGLRIEAQIKSPYHGNLVATVFSRPNELPGQR
jgi:hypothetical protein